MLSDETVVEQHPWIDDPKEEMERLKKQKEEEQAEFERQGYNPFGQQGKQLGTAKDEGGEAGEK